MPCADKPVHIGNQVENEVQGSGEWVQGLCIKAEVTSKVRIGTVQSINHTQLKAHRLVFYHMCGKSNTSVQGFDDGRFCFAFVSH